MANLCGICKKKVGIFTRTAIKDGFICSDCYKKSAGVSDANCRSAQDFKDRYEYLEQMSEVFSKFSATSRIGNYLEVDENNKLFKINKSSVCYPFSSLVNFELNEDGETTSKGGLGRAVAGGVLFGGIGAVVGGVTGGKKSRSVVTSMYIRISLNDKWVKTESIQLINFETKKNGMVYRNSKTTADKIISALETIVNQQESTMAEACNNKLSVTDEILKYKQLLDLGAISADEFESKKKQLLAL